MRTKDKGPWLGGSWAGKAESGLEPRKRPARPSPPSFPQEPGRENPLCILPSKSVLRRLPGPTPQVGGNLWVATTGPKQAWPRLQD